MGVGGRQEPGHSVCVRSEIRIRRQHELLGGSRRQQEEPGRSASGGETAELVGGLLDVSW